MSPTRKRAHSAAVVLSVALFATTTLQAQVPNDECATALAIGFGVNGPFQSTLATLSSTPWTCGTGSGGIGSDVWFTFNANCGGSYTFSTCTATLNFDTVLQVFSGTCGSLVLAGCNEDAGGTCGVASTLTVNLAPGTHYVRVGGSNQQSGSFDVVVTGPPVYDAGPFITSNTGGFGGAPISLWQSLAPMSMTARGFLVSGSYSLADDFVTNGAWCISAIELFAYQVGSQSPSITGVFLEIYGGDPSAGAAPVAGSPGLANNLLTTAGYRISNTMTGVFRADDTNPTGGNRPIQSVMVTLANPLNLDSATIAGGRYFLRWSLTGTGTFSSGPFTPPITVLGSRATGDALWPNSASWAPALSGGVGQGVPFKLFGTTGAALGALTNLGGGCSTAGLTVRGAPHVGGVVQIDMVNTNPAALQLVVLGFTDPAAPLAPFCGCVQHATLDVVNYGRSYNWQIPTIPSAVGFELFVQGYQVFAPNLACDIGAGFRFDMTDGWSIRLN